MSASQGDSITMAKQKSNIFSLDNVIYLFL